MANKKIQATATLFLDTKDAQNDAKKFVNDLKQKLSEVETAADKMTVFKDMVAYIAQVDRALAALRKNNKEAFNSMFDGLDINLKQQLEGLFGVNGAQLGQVDALREKLNTLTLKSSIKEIRTFAKEINTLFTSIGVSAPFDNINEQFSGRTNTGHIQALATSLANFATVWEDLSARVSQGFGGAGGSGSGVFGGLNNEVQEEIDKLKKQKEDITSIVNQIKEVSKMSSAWEDGDAINLDFEATEEAAQKLIDRFKQLDDAINNNEFDDKSVAYADALTERAKIALQLIELNNRLIKTDVDGGVSKNSPSFLRNFLADNEDGDNIVNYAIEDFVNETEDLLENLQEESANTIRQINELKKSINDTFSTDGGKSSGSNTFESIGDAAEDAGDKVDTFSKKVDNLNESIKRVYMSALDLEVDTRSGNASGKEFMNLFGADGIVSTTQGVDYQVDTDTLVQQLVANLNRDIVMSLHNHANGDMSFSPSDINSFAKMYYGQGTKINGIIANGFIHTIDFNSIGQEVAIQIAQDYQDGIQHLFEAKNIAQFASFENGSIVPSDLLKQAQASNPEYYQEVIDQLQEAQMTVLRQAFEKNGAEFTLQSFGLDNIDELSTYLANVQKNTQNAIEPVEKLKNLISTLRPSADLSEFTEVFDKFKNGAIDGSQALNQVLNLTPNNISDKTIDETNQKLREQEQLWENVKIAIKNGIGESVGIESLAETLELIEREIKEGILTSIEECIARFKEWNNISEEESLTLIGKRERIIDEHNYGTYLIGEDEVVSKEEADKLKQLSVQQEQLYQNLRSAIKGTLSDIVDVDDMTYAFDTLEKEIEAGLLTTLDQCIERFKLLTGLDDKRLTSIKDDQRVADSWDYYQGNRYVDDGETVIDSSEYNKFLNERAELLERISSLRSKVDGMPDTYFTEGDLESFLQEYCVEIDKLQNELAELKVSYEVLKDANQFATEDLVDYEREVADLNKTIDDLQTKLNSKIGETGTGVGSTNAIGDSSLTADSEVAQLELLQQKLLEVKTAVDAKTQAFEEEYVTVDGVVDAEITSLQSLIAKLQEVVAQINLINDGFNNINTNAPKVELKSAPVEQSGATENTHYVTDPQGRPVNAYRGIEGAYSGLVSNRYHGGTFWTTNIELAKEYAGEIGKVEKSLLSMKNPMEIDGQGAYWNQIEYIGDNSDEASQKLHQLNATIKQTETILEHLKTIQPTEKELKDLSRGFISETKNDREIREYTEALEKAKAERDAIFADTSNPYGKKNTNELVEIAKSKGYDGVIFKDIIDSATGSVTDLSTVMVTFEQNQIHYIETISSTFESAVTSLKNHFGDLTQHISASSEEVESSIRKMVELRGKVNAGEISEDEYNAFISQNAIARDYGKLAKKSRAVPDFITGALDGNEFELKHVIESINGMLDNMRERMQNIAKAFGKEGVPLDQLLADSTNVVPITESSVDEANVTDEVEQLNKLQTMLTEVKNAILAKTKAFVDEGDVVGQVVGKEVSALMKLAETVDSIVPKVNSLSTKMASIGPIDFVVKKDSGVAESGTTTEDKFKTRVDSKKSSMTKYINDLKDVQYVTDDTRDELIGLRDALDTVKTPKDLNDIIAKFEKLQTVIGILKTSFEKTGLNDIQNVERSLLGSFNTLDIDQKRELEPERDAVIKQLETYKNTVLNGQKVELQAIEDTVRALRKKIEVYKQANKEASNAGSTQKKNSKFGDTVSRNATAKYNSLMGSANSDQFANSKEVAAIVGEYEKAYKSMIAFRNELRNSDGIVSEADEVEFKRLTIECNEYAKALDKLIKSTMKLKGNKANPNDYMLGSDFVDNAQGRKQALTDFVKSVYDIDVAAEDFRKDWNEVVFAVDNGDGTFTQMTAKLTDARNEIVALAGDTKKVQSKLESFVDGLKNRLQSLSQYFIATVGIYDVWNVIKQGIQYVRDIDSALTELRKVTNETEASYAQFLQTASKTASMVGSTVSDFVNATADFARLGYDLNQASQLAEAASVYKNVGDGIDDISQASESIISTMKAFGIEANNAMGIVDRFNEVGNNFAISSTGIGEAMQRSASALYEAGNTIDESIALITGANSVIQNPEQVGTALKTLALRLRGAKVELEEAGEDVDGMAESTSQLQEKLLALTHGKVDIMLDENTFKNTTQILREMSAAWEHMTDIERASALELMGGKRQANILSSVIKNFDTVEDVITTSMDSAGSALRENEKYLESIQGRIDIFNNSVQTMWMNLIDSNMVKGVVDIGTFLVKQLDTLHGKIILIGTALAGLKIHDIMKTTGKGFTAVFNELFDIVVEKIKTLPNMIQSIVPATQNVIKSMKLIANATSGVVKADIGRAAASAGVSNQLTRQIIAEAGLKGVTTALTAEQIKATAATLHAKFAAGELTAAQYLTMMSTMGLKTAFKALCDVLKLNPFYAIAAVIAGAAWALDKFTTTAQEAADTAKKAFDEIQSVVDSTKSTIQSLETELSTLNDKIEELTGKELSFADNEELKKLKAQREELEHSLKVQEQLLQLQKDTSNKQAVASMKAYTKAASEGAKETQDTAKNVGTISGALAGAAITLGVLLAVPTGGTSLAATLGLSGTAVAGSAAAMGAAGGYFGNKLGESVGSGIASNKGTYDSWYETYTKALDAAREDEQEALEKYQKDSSNIDKLDKWQEAQQRTSEIEKEMYDHLSQMQQYMNSLEYGVSDEIDAELDTWNNFLDKFSIDQGASGSEVTALDRIFGENASDEIQTIKEQILEAVKTGKDFDFASAINGSQELKDTLDYVGLSAEEVKNYFTQIGEAASNVPKEITPVATYSDLLEDAEAYKEILLQTSEIIVDNTKVTADYKDGLIALVGSEAEVNKYFDKTNKLIVKDAKGLNTLVQATKKNVAANASLAKSQARLQYYQLFKKMQACVSAKGIMFNATKSEVLALYQEMNALEKTIAQYSRLEAQLLDTGNAYDQFEKAQEIDSATDYVGSIETWIAALGEAFNTAELGTESAQVAIKGLVPESVYKDLDTVDEKMAAIYSYFKTGKLAQYVDIQFDEDGAIESAEMKLGNLRKFIEDGLVNGTLIGSDWRHFDLSEDIDSLEEFADAMGVTKEVAFAFIESMEDHDIEWLNGDYSSIFEDILPDNLANDIYENTSALADLAVQLANGEITAEEYTAQWSELNKVSQENAQKARENATAWIETSNDIEAAKTKVQELSDELQMLKQQGASEAEIQVKTQELNAAEQDLTNLVAKLSELETMDPVVLQVALDQAQAEIDEFETANSTLLTKIEVVQDKESGEYSYNVKAGITLDENEKKKLEGYLEDINAKYSFEAALGEDIVTAEDHLQSIENILQSIHDVLSGKNSSGTKSTDATEVTESVDANGFKEFFTTTIPDALKGLWEDIDTFFTETIPEKWSQFWEEVGNKFSEIIEKAGILKEKVTDFFTNTVPEKWDGFWDEVGEKVADIKKFAGELQEKVDNFFTKTFPQKWDEFWNDVETFLVETLPYTLSYSAGTVSRFFTETIPQKWDEFWDAVKTKLNEVRENAKILKEKIVNYFTVLIPQKWNEFWDDVGAKLEELKAEAKILKEKVVTFFTVTIPEKWNAFWDSVGAKIEELKKEAQILKVKITEFFTVTIPQKWNAFWNDVGTFITTTIPSALETVKTGVTTFFTVTVPNAINGLWNGISSWISEKASNLWSSLTSGWSDSRSGSGYNPSGSSGRQRVNGTAHARGTAYQSGNWGLPKSEHDSLVGELGPEMVVDPSSGRYYTVGDTGAEMVDLPKGAIIFNHKQTESLLNNGYVTSRGKAYAEGNAHVTIWPNASSKDQWEGTGYDSWHDPTWDPSDAFSNAADDLSDAADSMSDAADDSEQVVDFIEMKLEEIEAIIEKTSARISNFLDDTTSINSKDELYDELVKAEKDKAEVYLKAAQKYDVQAAAALSGVPQQYQEMARNGDIAIEEFLGEDQVEIAEKIQEYRDWAAKADEAENGHLEAIAAISAHRVEQLEDIATDFENIVSISKSHSDLLQAEMDFIEESGNRLSESYYEELKKHSQKQLNDMQNERVALQKILDDAVAAGDVIIGSDDWYSMLETIYEVDQEIIDCKTSLEEFQNAINDLYWDNFDKLIENLDNVNSELSSLYDLISDDDKIVDDMGNWTADGYTALGLLIQQMEVAQQKSKEYGDAISKLKKDYKDGLYSTDEYNEKLAELTDGQYDAIKSYEDAKDAIIDLNKTRVDAVKDGIEKEIEAYEELISKKKESLDADKDARDFERSVEESNKSISDVKRKIASLKGNTSSSAIAERRRLEEELRKLQQEREDLFYDESVENQQEALDKELENFKDAKNKEIEDLEEYLKNQEKVLQDSFAIVQENTQQIVGKLVEITEDYGVTLSDTVATPWIKGTNAIGTYEEQLNTSVSATTKNLETLKQQLKDLETQADQTANSVINSTHSSIVKTNDGHQTSIKGYAKGSKSVEYDQWALIDELGDELQITPDGSGRLAYIKKGTVILNNTLTERLMDLAMDPTSMIENSRPVIGTPGIITTNNTITVDASVGTLLHVEHLDGSNPAEVTKLVDKAWEKKMQTLNNSIKKFTR